MSFVAIFFPSVRFNTGSNFGSHRLHFVFLSFSFAMCACMHAKSLQSCLILCNPMDCSPPGSSVHGILQAKILEWVAMPFSSLLHVAVQFSQHHLLKRLSLPHCYILASFVKNKVPIGAWVYFWDFSLVPLVCIFVLCQYHTVLMTVAL